MKPSPGLRRPNPLLQFSREIARKLRRRRAHAYPDSIVWLAVRAINEYLNTADPPAGRASPFASTWDVTAILERGAHPRRAEDDHAEHQRQPAPGYLARRLTRQHKAMRSRIWINHCKPVANGQPGSAKPAEPGWPVNLPAACRVITSAHD